MTTETWRSQTKPLTSMDSCVCIVVVWVVWVVWGVGYQQENSHTTRKSTPNTTGPKGVWMSEDLAYRNIYCEMKLCEGVSNCTYMHKTIW